MTVARVTQGTVETVTTGTAKARVTQGTIEVVATGTVKARLTQAFVETLTVAGTAPVYTPIKPGKGKPVKDKWAEFDDDLPAGVALEQAGLLLRKPLAFLDLGPPLAWLPARRGRPSEAAQEEWAAPAAPRGAFRWPSTFEGLPTYWLGLASRAGQVWKYRLPYSNLQASVNPTVTDDANANYAPGSLWINKAGETAWVCLRSTAGAAVWQLIGAGGGGGITDGDKGDITVSGSGTVWTIDVVDGGTW